MYKPPGPFTNQADDTQDTLQSSRSALKGTGLEDKAKSFLHNNRDNLGVWDAIAIADANRY